MDRLLAPHSPEATPTTTLGMFLLSVPPVPFSGHATSLTHPELTCLSSSCSENTFSWHTDQPSVDETRSELESILRRYAYDAIHNAIASSRSQLQTGGYSRVCHLAEKSIRDVLNTSDNVNILLALHRPAGDSPNSSNHDAEENNSTRITTK
ncbi:hypothetical protein BDZ97DRAFT_1911726 [Flammula alnicola]|nr:hypothetical protein BDZ97DRAFT_1911726 [Flammula alnicola]